ncbi:MAG: D-alanine--D-alanine ligase [Parcubacteria group bacterium Gr01-1014_33]|nr:MAG: D-alanine--D-alanine ligase [Parcubacteria group bacterium Gr01-1014_33]
MVKKIKVLVLMGGPSSEHEVSLMSGGEVFKALPHTYKGIRGVIPKDANLGEMVHGLLRRHKPDIVFIAMHGSYGEDGRVQALLETMGVPYTGSGVLASALAMDKPRACAVFRDAGFSVPPSEVIHKDEKPGRKFFSSLLRRVGMPLVVKPADAGSSVGVTIVRRPKEFQNALRRAFHFSERVIVQKFIKGREVTCGIVEMPGGFGKLPPIEIIPKAGAFYDYKSKYAAGGSEHVIPPEGLKRRVLYMIQDYALRAHMVLDCSGMSRADFILDSKGVLWILEINTIPGMTPTSLLPDGARAAGIAFPRLLDLIIRAALRRFPS